MVINRFRLKEESIREYLDILNEFYRDQNYQRLGINISRWSRKNGKSPIDVYRHQMKIFKWR